MLTSAIKKMNNEEPESLFCSRSMKTLLVGGLMFGSQLAWGVCENGRAEEFVSQYNEEELPFCSDARQDGLGIFTSILKIIPGIGQLAAAIDSGVGIAEASVCSNNGVVFTWEQVVDEIEKRTGERIEEDRRCEINNRLGDLFLDFGAMKTSIENAVSLGDFNVVVDIVRDFKVRVGELESQFKLLSKVTAAPMLTEISSLKYAANLILVELIKKQEELGADLPGTLKTELNQNLEFDRKATVRAMLDVNDDFNVFHNNAELSRTHRSFSSGAPTNNVTFVLEDEITNGEGDLIFDDKVSRTFLQSNDKFRREFFHRRDNFAKNSNKLFAEALTEVNEVISDDYYDVFNSHSVLKGKRFFIVSKGNQCLSSSNVGIGENFNLFLDDCPFSDDGTLVDNPETLGSLWRVQNRTGMLVNDRTERCLMRTRENNTGLSGITSVRCMYDSVPFDDVTLSNLDKPSSFEALEQLTRTFQEWGIHPAGLIVSRAEENSLCLDAKASPLLSVFGGLQAKACETGQTKGESGTGTPAALKFEASDQVFALKYLQCSPANNCKVTSELSVNNGLGFAANQTRVVLPVGLVGELQGSAKINLNKEQLAAVGNLSMKKVADRIIWTEQEIILGTYRLTVHLKGAEGNLLAEKLRINVLVNGKPIPLEVNELALLDEGESGISEFDLELPEYGTTLAIEALDNENYLVEKLVLTPVF